MKLQFRYGSKDDTSKETATINFRIYHGKFDKRGSLYLDISREMWDDKTNYTRDTLKNPTGDFKTNERIREIKKELDRFTSIYEDELYDLKRTRPLKSITKIEFENFCNGIIQKFNGKDLPERWTLIQAIEKTRDDKFAINEIKTKNHHNRAIKKIEAFQKDTKKVYYTEEVNMNFYVAFKKWCDKQYNFQTKGIGLDIRTFSNFIREIKSSINYLRGHVNDFPYSKEIDSKRFKVHKSKKVHDVLREEHIEKLYSFKGKEVLEKVRDLAIIQYHACLRFSELADELNGGYDNLKIYPITDPEGNTSFEWDFYQVKVKDMKTIPVHKRLVDMYQSGRIKELYNNTGKRKGKIMTIQRYNPYLKEIMKELEIPIEIASHTLRRSFITNMINNKYSHHEVMQYSGHDKLDAFQGYCQRHNIKLKGGNTIPTE